MYMRTARAASDGRLSSDFIMLLASRFRARSCIYIDRYICIWIDVYRKIDTYIERDHVDAHR